MSERKEQNPVPEEPRKETIREFEQEAKRLAGKGFGSTINRLAVEDQTGTLFRSKSYLFGHFASLRLTDNIPNITPQGEESFPFKEVTVYKDGETQVTHGAEITSPLGSRNEKEEYRLAHETDIREAVEVLRRLTRDDIMDYQGRTRAEKGIHKQATEVLFDRIDGLFAIADRNGNLTQASDGKMTGGYAEFETEDGNIVAITSTTRSRHDRRLSDVRDVSIEMRNYQMVEPHPDIPSWQVIPTINYYVCPDFDDFIGITAGNAYLSDREEIVYDKTFLFGKDPSMTPGRTKPYRGIAESADIDNLFGILDSIESNLKG